MTERTIEQRIRDLLNVKFYRYCRYVNIRSLDLPVPMIDLETDPRFYCYLLPTIWSESYYSRYPSGDIYLDDLEEETDLSDLSNLWMISDLSTSGDYVGNGTVGLSNKRVLCDDLYHRSGYGGYGYTFAAISTDFLLNPANSEEADQVLDALESLSDYPVLSDDDLSDLERGAETEAWDNWISFDFSRALSRAFPDLSDQIDDIPDDNLKTLFYQGCEKSNTYPYPEGYGDSMYVDIDQVIKVISPDVITSYLNTHNASGISLSG